MAVKVDEAIISCKFKEVSSWFSFTRMLLVDLLTPRILLQKLRCIFCNFACVPFIKVHIFFKSTRVVRKDPLQLIVIPKYLLKFCKITLRHEMLEYVMCLVNLTDINRRTDWFKIKKWSLLLLNSSKQPPPPLRSWTAVSSSTLLSCTHFTS